MQISKLALIAASLTLAAHAQSPAPAFEVASIRPNVSGQRIMLFQPRRGGRFTANNCSLELLIQYAYDVQRYQISSAPDWVKSERYDVAAKAEGDPPVEELQAMLRNLLENRFQLKYHWGTKPAALYHLVVSKPGKLKEVEPGDCPSIFSPRAAAPVPDDAPCGSLRNTPGKTKGYRMTAEELAGSLAFFVQRSVLDKTGLTGKYDIELQWTPEPALMQSLDSPEAGPPSIFTALQEQLGLKLESAKGPVKFLVIDYVAKPSEN